MKQSYQIKKGWNGLTFAERCERGAFLRKNPFDDYRKIIGKTVMVRNSNDANVWIRIESLGNKNSRRLITGKTVKATNWDFVGHHTWAYVDNIITPDYVMQRWADERQWVDQPTIQCYNCTGSGNVENSEHYSQFGL